ncbi:MAG TPA: S24/S26 family peptidase [Opitutaceae bacterium]|jgi:hypothetical protein
MNRAPSFIALGLLAVGSVFFTGCSNVVTSEVRNLSLQDVAKYSPAPKVVSAYEAIEGAKEYVRAHPGSDYQIGSGESMAPLYHDHAVIVTERPALDTLHTGQTVVFVNTDGIPVAHTLLSHTARGWVTMGLGNNQPDEGYLTDAAYVGVVVKAFQATESPILAYAKSAPKGALLASNP